jgi:phage tail sheath gpL-like
MSGTLAFKYFPSQLWRPSGVNIEFDASQANTATQNQRALLIGQILASGTATPNVPVQGYSQAQVNGLCGADSMLALQYAAYRIQDPFGEVWLGPLSDASAGTAATGTMVFTGPATAAGTLALYLMGVSVPVPVNLGDTAIVIAANVAVAATAAVGVPATATAATGTATLTAQHKGLALNDLDIRLNYVGVQNGEATPPGVTMTVTPMAGGATNPLLTTLLANLGVQLFDFIACPYTDLASLNALQAFLSDSAGRWSAEEMQYGHVFAAFNGTYAARTTFGITRNDQHASILGYYGSPTPAWLECADWCAVHVIRIRVNPAQGLSTQALGLLPPPLALQDTPGERNTMLFDGISTYTVDAAGVCRIDRTITTYQVNPSGQPDDSYLGTNLLYQAMYTARYISAQVTSQFIAAGKILVSNGTPIGPGSPATTPNAVLGSVVAIYAYLCTVFVVQNPQTFAANAYATNGTKGQVLLYLPFDFSDQIINVGILAQFVQST